MQATRVLPSFLVFDTFNHRQSGKELLTCLAALSVPVTPRTCGLTEICSIWAAQGFFLFVLLRCFIFTISLHSFPNSDDLLTNFFNALFDSIGADKHLFCICCFMYSAMLILWFRFPLSACSYIGSASMLCWAIAQLKMIAISL